MSGKKLILFHREDAAGRNIAKILKELLNNFEHGSNKNRVLNEFEHKDITVIECDNSILYLDNFNEFPDNSNEFCLNSNGYVFNSSESPMEISNEFYSNSNESDPNSNESPIELCIVASRHKSKSGMPTLTCHSPGNFGRADMGGEEKKLGIAPAMYLRGAILSLQRQKERLRETWLKEEESMKNESDREESVKGESKREESVKEESGRNKSMDRRDYEVKIGLDDYEVTLEATHHGPTLNIPMLFIEVGSTEKQWMDLGACGAAAWVILEVIGSTPSDNGFPVAIGFGGGHYCRKFTGLSREYAIGHICPKYNLHNLDSEMITQMIKRTLPKPEYALVEKKGMGKEKRRVIGLLDDSELGVVLV